MVRIDWKCDQVSYSLCFPETNTLLWIGRHGGNIDDCAWAVVDWALTSWPDRGGYQVMSNPIVHSVRPEAAV
jgi:hypothetical protein